MASTYSPSLKITLMGDGDQAGLWGQTTNTNLGTLLEQAITGVQSIVMLDANYTLTSFNGVSDEARNAVLVVTGTNNAIRDLIPPVVEKLYTIVNNTTGGFAIRVIGSSGTGVNIPNGATCLVYCDGTSFFNGLSGSAGNFAVSSNLSVTGTTALSSALTGTTGVFSGAISSVSPTFTGTPTAPTATFGTNTTQIATTAFVQAAIPAGVIVLWSGSVVSIPSGWYLCDGTNSTPDLRSRFVVGAGSTYAVAATGGSADAVVVSHNHSATSSVVDSGHSHTIDTLINGGGPDKVYPGAAGGNLITASTNSAVTGISVNTTTANTGTSGTGANLPPYYALAYIMKA
jgi:hypothetical protein